jgi:non-heme chloroperoxidase
MTTRTRFSVTTPAGVVLEGARQGVGNGTPLVLLHCYSDSHRSFEPLLAVLPPDIDAIAFTQRGHGDSSKPRGAYRAADFAGDADAVLRAQGCERAVIVGHSMGAWMALRFALDYPERVVGLVLIGGFASFAESPGVQALWADDVSHIVDPVSPEFVRGFQEGASSSHLPSQFLADVVAESLKMPAHVWSSVLKATMSEELIDELHRITVPTRLVWGEHDPYASRQDQQRLLRALPQSTLVCLRGQGHSPHWEEPAAVAGELLDFLATLAS